MLRFPEHDVDDDAARKGGVFLCATVLTAAGPCETDRGGCKEGLDGVAGGAQRWIGHRARPGGVA